MATRTAQVGPPCRRRIAETERAGIPELGADPDLVAPYVQAKTLGRVRRA